MSAENDQKTADAFATSWNNLPTKSVYTFDQFVDWFLPLEQGDVEGKTMLELGCGNASLMVHVLDWQPAKLIGVDLGDSVLSAEKNLAKHQNGNWQIKKADLTAYVGEPVDITYCIGVLHHLKESKKGFESLLRNVKAGGHFHVWVYAHEGNAVIRFVVDPLRKIVSRLPWWFTKYFVATPLVLPYFIYAKLLRGLTVIVGEKFLAWLPLYRYSLWIAKRNFGFFRHVAFDQLVTPQTAYIKKQTIVDWLADPRIDQSSTYIIFRNGNSWKFGGKTKS